MSDFIPRDQKEARYVNDMIDNYNSNRPGCDLEDRDENNVFSLDSNNMVRDVIKFVEFYRGNFIDNYLENMDDHEIHKEFIDKLNHSIRHSSNDSEEQAIIYMDAVKLVKYHPDVLEDAMPMIKDLVPYISEKDITDEDTGYVSLEKVSDLTLKGIEVFRDGKRKKVSESYSTVNNIIKILHDSYIAKVEEDSEKENPKKDYITLNEWIKKDQKKFNKKNTNNSNNPKLEKIISKQKKEIERLESKINDTTELYIEKLKELKQKEKQISAYESKIDGYESKISEYESNMKHMQIALKNVAEGKTRPILINEKGIKMIKMVRNDDKKNTDQVDSLSDILKQKEEESLSKTG